MCLNLQAKKGARGLEEMISEHESPMTKEEEIFSSDNDGISGYTTGLNMITESPETNFSEDCYQNMYPPADPQPDRMKKIIKTTATTQVSVPVRSPNPREMKNRPILRLNIPKTDDTNKEAIKERQNQGSANSKKQLSAQKSFTKKPFDKPFERKTDIMMSPFPFLGLEAQNHQLNMRLVNLLNSPYKQDVNQRRPANFPTFNNEEDNFGPHFADFSPFTFQAIGSTPPPIKQIQGGEDHFSTDKIVNYLSHPGRSPPQQQGVFTFQQAELATGMESEPLVSSKKTGNAFWEFPYNGKESCGKMDNGLASASRSGYKFNFEGYSFGNDERIKDWGEAMRRMKMV